MIVLFSIWFIATFDNSPVLPSDGLKIGWWQSMGTVQFFLLPFVGMNITGHIDYLTLTLWIICACLFILAILSLKRNQRQEFNVLYLRLFLLTFLGYVSLPFWLGDFSYFNVRMSIICYFFLAVLISEIKLPRFSTYVLVVALCCVMMITFKNNQTLSTETEQLLPLIKHMKKNSTVYPIYLDATPGKIDKMYFYQYHTHNDIYFNIIKGGWGQKFFNSKMLPIQIKNHVCIPVFENKPDFYEYIILRTSDTQKKYSFKKHRYLMESGSWKLYQHDLTLK